MWLKLAFLLMFVLACAKKEESAKEEEHAHKEEAVEISKDVLDEMDIRTFVASEGYLYKEVKIPAEVIKSRNASTLVRARFSGIIADITRKLGDRVSKGDVLAYIESDESFSWYPVRSPISGTLTKQFVSKGEAVDKGEVLFEVVSLREVWVKAMLYPKDAHIVRKGQKVKVHRHFGEEYEEFEGRVFLVSPEVDEETRLIPIYISVKNRKNLLKPGMYGDVIVLDSVHVDLRIPKTAVHIVENDTFVFMKEGEHIVKRKVSLGKQGLNFVEVLRGLEQGDTVFSQNSFVIRAEMEKEEWMGEGHTH